MTVYTPTIKGGPAGDLGLAALATVLRYGYAMGYTDHLTHRDEDALEHFAAFLAGHRPSPPLA